jgi:hypothetical protein
VGDLVQVRSRRWLVEGVVEIRPGRSTRVRLACAEDDAQGDAGGLLGVRARPPDLRRGGVARSARLEEVPGTYPVPAQKVQETKVALRELGLKDSLEGE